MAECLLIGVMLWPFLAALISCALRKKPGAQGWFAAGAATLELALMACLALLGGTPVSVQAPGFMGMGLRLTFDGIGGVYGVITALAFTLTGLFAPGYFCGSRGLGAYYSAWLLTLGGTVGVFFSADLPTLFIFFEIMSFASFLLVTQSRTQEAVRAGGTYLAVSVCSGLSVLLGIFLLRAGCIAAAVVCLLAGFGAKAGMVPLHFWLPGAHAAAPAPASALLSGILTKTGVFGIILAARELPQGNAALPLVLVLLGLGGMLTGAILALLSTHMKRLLAYSSVSQIGFILLGIGMTGFLGEHSALALQGTLLHMVNHSLAKIALFLAAGVVGTRLHTYDLGSIRGFGRGRPVFTLAVLMGAASLAGVPPLGGYISKTLLHEAIVEQMLASAGEWRVFFSVTEILFMLTGGLTAAYMLKLIGTLYARPGALPTQGRSPGRPGQAALLAAALSLPALGLYGARSLAYMAHFFSWHALRGALLPIAGGALLYGLVVRRWPADRRPVFSLESAVYRPAVRGLIAVGGFVSACICAIPAALLRPWAMGLAALQRGHDAREPAVESPFLRLRDRYEARAGRARQRAILRPGRIRAGYAALAERSRQRANARPERVRAGYAALAKRSHSAAEAFATDTLHAYSQASKRIAAATGDFWEGEPEPSRRSKGVYIAMVRYAQHAQARLQALLRVPSIAYSKLSTGKDSLFRSEMMRTMFSSLAFSFFLYLLAFVVVLLIVL